MNRKLVVFFLLLGVFAVSHLIDQPERGQYEASDGLPVIPQEAHVDVHYFYGEGCSQCAVTEPLFVEMEEKYPITVHRYDVYSDRSFISLFHEYSGRYGLPQEQLDIPAVFFSSTFLIGEESILQGLEDTLTESMSPSCLSEASSKAGAVEAVASEVTSATSSLSIMTFTIAALVDAVSPCSIAILIFLIGARALLGDQKKRALKVGLSFCLAVFTSYMLFGLGLMTIIQATGFSSTFASLAGFLAVLVGLLYLKDVFWRGKGGFAMEVPEALKPLLMKLLKGVATPVGAFAMGFVASSFELPCTGGPYLFILGQLADEATRLQTLPLLLYYNFIFVLPLISISLLLYSNVISLGRVRDWNLRNKRLLRTLGGVTMLVIGSMALIPVHSLIQTFHLVLYSVKPWSLPLIAIVFTYLLTSLFRKALLRPDLVLTVDGLVPETSSKARVKLRVPESRTIRKAAFTFILLYPLLMVIIVPTPLPAKTTLAGQATAINAPEGSGERTPTSLVSSERQDDQFNDLLQTMNDGLASGKPIFVFFYLETCGWCTKQKPILAQLESNYADSVLFIEVDGRENREAVETFGVSGYPYSLLITGKDEGGFITERFPGYTTIEVFLEAFERVLINERDLKLGDTLSGPLTPYPDGKLGSDLQSTFTLDGSIKTYDIHLALALSGAEVEFNLQDLIDYSGAADIPLLVKYESPVVYGGTISDIRLTPTNFETVNLIEATTTSVDGEFKRAFKTVPYASLSVPRDRLKELTSNLQTIVEEFYVNPRSRTMLNESIPIIKDPNVTQTIEAKYGPLNGSGVTIAIIDTGVDKTHLDLNDLDDNATTSDPKVVGEKCFCTPEWWRTPPYDVTPCCPNGEVEDENAADDNGHGTHCAGIAAGTGEGSNYTFVGVAPQAELLAVKVCDFEGSCLGDDIIAGIDWAVSSDADVISLSLGGSRYRPLEEMVEHALAQGVVVVVAAGNDGSGLFTIETPGVVKDAITVGATSKNDNVVSYSSRGPTDDFLVKPDIVAPGGNVNTGCSSCSPDCCRYPQGVWSTGTTGEIWDCYGSGCGETIDGNRYIRLSGTSMATPHVAGAAALLLQVHPNWNPAEVKSSLVNNAQDLGQHVYKQGGGRLDIYAAVDNHLIVDEPVLNIGNVSSDLTSITHNFSLKNVGDTSYGIIIASDAIRNVQTGTLYDIVEDISGNNFCLNSADVEDVQFTVNLTTPPLGFYSGFLRIDVYQACNFSSAPKRLNVPLGFSRIKRLHIEFVNPPIYENEEKWHIMFFRPTFDSKEYILYFDSEDSHDFYVKKEEFDVMAMTGQTNETGPDLNHKLTYFITGVNLTGDDYVSLVFNVTSATSLRQNNTNLDSVIESRNLTMNRIGYVLYFGTFGDDKDFFDILSYHPGEWDLAVENGETLFRDYELTVGNLYLPNGTVYGYAEEFYSFPLQFYFPFTNFFDMIEDHWIHSRTIKFYYSIESSRSYLLMLSPMLVGEMSLFSMIEGVYLMPRDITFIYRRHPCRLCKYEMFAIIGYGTRFYYELNHLQNYPDPITVLKRPFSPILTKQMGSGIKGTVKDSYGYADIHFESNRGSLSITKPDGSRYTSSGEAWQILCYYSNPFPCQTGDYVVDWHIDDIIKNQDIYYTGVIHYNIEWNIEEECSSPILTLTPNPVWAEDTVTATVSGGCDGKIAQVKIGPDRELVCQCTIEWGSCSCDFEALKPPGSPTVQTYYVQLDVNGDGDLDSGEEYSEDLTVYCRAEGASCNSDETCCADYSCVGGICRYMPIISPEPKNYHIETLWLNVTADFQVDSWWYQLNSGGNTSFTPNTTIAVDECFNTLTVYVNDTEGNEGYSKVKFNALTGDVDGDRDVDIQDVVSCVYCYGSTSADPEYLQVCDVNPPPGGDGKIDIFDIVTITRKYGERC